MRTEGSGIQGIRDLLKGKGAAPAVRGAAARRLARSWKWGGVGLVLLCLAVYLPGLFSIPPVDRDESRFAMASWQMYTSGDWVVPRIQEKARLNKPPLIYWLQAGAWAVLGSERWENGGIWVFRLPSVGAAIATVLLTWRLGVRMFDPRAAWLGAALLAVCPMVVWDAHQARADQVLLTTVVGTQFALWVIWSARGDERKRGGLVTPVLFWVCLALGIMTKGPITPMVAGLTALSLSVVSRELRWLARLRPLMGIAIVLLLVGPWVYLVGERVGWSEYLGIVYDETLGRSAGAKEGHWGPPGYHTVLLGVLFWPGSLLTALAIGKAIRRGLRVPSATDLATGESRGRLRRWLAASPGRRAELFCLAWVVPSWLVFELVSTKLPHYTMPMYPAIALVSARATLGLGKKKRSQHSPAEAERVIRHLADHDVECPRCGYSMRSLPSARCPECGTTASLTRDGRLVDASDASRAQRLGDWVWLVIGGALLVIFPGLLLLVDWVGFRNAPPLTAVALDVDGGPGLYAIGFAIALPSTWLLWSAQSANKRRDPIRAVLLGTSGLVAAYLALFQFMLPSARWLWISTQVVRALNAIDPERRLPVADMGYHEDSLVFLTRGQVASVTSVDHAVMWLKEHPHSVVITSDVFAAAVANLRDYDSVEFHVGQQRHFRGYNYSKGKQEWQGVMELWQ